jgi:peptidyl-prolyl cis-trans isomerase B (cyclophilin B)
MAAANGRPPPAFSIVPDTAHSPRTANSFIFLACSGYYTGATFDRVIPGVLIEGGTPAALPSGGPGYAFSQEQAIGSYTRGTVVMAADGSPTEGGRFFILLDSITLPPQFTILGSLSTGIGTVDRISRAPSRLQPDAQEQTLPLQPQRIVSVSLSVR